MTGWFKATLHGCGEVEFEIEETKFWLESVLPENPEVVGLVLSVKAKEKAAPLPCDREISYLHMQTEWLDIPVTALVSKDLAALDGFHYKLDPEAEDIVDWPAFIYDGGSYGSTIELELRLTHLRDGMYKLWMTGKTEFDDTFEIDTELQFSHTIWRIPDGSRDDRVEAFQNRLFEAKTFNWQWLGDPDPVDPNLRLHSDFILKSGEEAQ